MDGTEQAVGDLLAGISEYILNPAILLLFAVALAVLFWGIVQFLMNPYDDAARTKGKRTIIWGIVGMFIMVAVFGIMQVIVNTFGLTTPDGGSPIESVEP